MARADDSPAGTKGISLFLVPKFIVKDDGTIGPRNGISTGSIETKMGIKGSATCVLNFDLFLQPPAKYLLQDLM